MCISRLFDILYSPLLGFAGIDLLDRCDTNILISLGMANPRKVFLLSPIFWAVALRETVRVRSVDQCVYDAGCVHAQKVDVVPALLHNQDFLTNLVQLVRHVSVK